MSRECDDASDRQVAFDEVISSDDPRFKVVMRLRMRQRKYEAGYYPVIDDEDDELDPEPWVVYCNGFPTTQRRSTWLKPGDTGAGVYYMCIFEPRTKYSQEISNYRGVK